MGGEPEEPLIPQNRTTERKLEQQQVPAVGGQVAGPVPPPPRKTKAFPRGQRHSSPPETLSSTTSLSMSAFARPLHHHHHHPPRSQGSQQSTRLLRRSPINSQTLSSSSGVSSGSISSSSSEEVHVQRPLRPVQTVTTIDSLAPGQEIQFTRHRSLLRQPVVVLECLPLRIRSLNHQEQCRERRPPPLPPPPVPRQLLAVDQVSEASEVAPPPLQVYIFLFKTTSTYNNISNISYQRVFLTFDL